MAMALITWFSAEATEPSVTGLAWNADGLTTSLRGSSSWRPMRRMGPQAKSYRSIGNAPGELMGIIAQVFPELYWPNSSRTAQES